MTNVVNMDPLVASNHEMWMRLASVAEQLEMNEHALMCYESALRSNQFNVPALDAAASLHRSNGNYAKAIDLYQQALNLDNTNGRAWASVAHCYVCIDDLHKAYTAYQQALIHIREPHDPFLWYGIGVLYDRYGSADHAREAFDAVLTMAPTDTFDRQAEVRFRLAMLNKQRRAYVDALDHLGAIVDCPPAPLTTVDVVCHIARVEELRGNYPAANMAYQRALELDPNSAKTLQQFAWYCHTRAVETTAHFDSAASTAVVAASTGNLSPNAAAAAVAAAAAAAAAATAVTETTTDTTATNVPPPPPPRTSTTADGTVTPADVDDVKLPGAAATADGAIVVAPVVAAIKIEQKTEQGGDTATTTPAAINTTIDPSVQADIAKLHERAEALLKRSIDIDPTDQFSYYLLGRCYMSRQDYRAAYDAYQQAVYRDGRNAAFWCSIGVLYYHIQQQRDALDAFSRAIRVDPRVPEVWFNLGTLYESCQQFADAGDAYHRAIELAPDETRFATRFANVGKPHPPDEVLEVVEPCAGTIVLVARHGALASPFGAHMNGSGVRAPPSNNNGNGDAQHEQLLQQAGGGDERQSMATKRMAPSTRGGRGGVASQYATQRGGKRQTVAPKSEQIDRTSAEWLLVQAQRMMGAAAASEAGDLNGGAAAAAGGDDDRLAAKRSRKRLSVD